MAKSCFNQLFVNYLILSVVLFAISPKGVAAVCITNFALLKHQKITSTDRMISIIWYMSLQVKQYCIAIPNFSSNAKLVTVTEAICQVVNCSAIRPGGKCYLPDVPYTHACWAMNLLYRHNGACDLEISQLITRDPCEYSTRIIYINSFLQYLCI